MRVMASQPVPGRAHPRRCGEHMSMSAESRTQKGSSPQVRGTCLCGPGSQQTRRLIPAGAGNMPRFRAPGRVRTAHPRRCGEHVIQNEKQAALRGSSPQVRGTCQGQHSGGSRLRLIPAGAGNIQDRRLAGFRRGAHPRRCGEHAAEGTADVYTRGSSPQVRGTSLPVGTDVALLGLIPAGAGNILTTGG